MQTTSDVTVHESEIRLLSGDSYLDYAMRVIKGDKRLILGTAPRDWLPGNLVSSKFAHLSFFDAVQALLEEEAAEVAKKNALHFVTLRAPVCPPQRLSDGPKLGLKRRRRHTVRAPPSY